MRRILLLALLFIAIGGTTEVYSQSWIKKLGKKVEEKAKQKVEEKAEKAVDKAFDKAEGAATDAVTGKGKDKKNTSNDDVSGQDAGDGAMQDNGTVKPQKGQSLEMTYAKSDFVPGDEIIFDDPMDNEQMGEWPSMWELYDGTGEVMSVGGKKAMFISERYTKVGPLMKNPKNYLGDVFTVEFDYFHEVNGESSSAWLVLSFFTADSQGHGGDLLMQFERSVDGRRYDGRYDKRWGSKWKTNNGEGKGDGEVDLLPNQWNHFAISFNKRAWKLYINGVRIVNVPNVKTPPGWLQFEVGNGNKNIYLTNLRIAKGAVPLYDRMMSEGKFITYGITFDVGKSTIKPESMGEINRIVKLMTDNPNLKFSVEGHTDSTGNEASNQTLSEQRSQAIVAKLVELGISADRLTASGKGQSSPIADNSTDEGRAKNRRVEFVKQ